MADLSIISAIPQAPNLVRATFSESFTVNDALYEKSNYAFVTRYGNDIPVYVSQVELTSPTSLDLWLVDAMLTDGHYELAVFNISSISTGVPIDQGTGNNSAIFDGVGTPLKCFAIKKRFPSWLNLKFGSNLEALVGATGKVNDVLAGESSASQLSVLEDALLLRTAVGTDLDTIGNNYGIKRPASLAGDDIMYRKLLPSFATRKKCIINVFYEVLRLLFGTDVGWGLYETTPNVLNLDISRTLAFGLAPGSLASATYFHADASVVSPPSYAGDYLVASAAVAGTTVGGNIVIIFQQIAIEDLLSPLRAAGIDLVITVIG